MDYLPYVLLAIALLMIGMQLRLLFSAKRAQGKPAPGFEDLSDEAQRGMPVLLFYFHSEYCGSCRRITPLVEAFAANTGAVIIVDVQILKMCESFASQGVMVTLLYQKRNNQQLEARVGNIFEYYAINNSFTMKKLYCLDSPLLEKIHSSIWFYVTTITYLLAAAMYVIRNRKAIDIIYCRDMFSLMLLGLLQPVLKLPMFYEAHAFP